MAEFHLGLKSDLVDQLAFFSALTLLVGIEWDVKLLLTHLSTVSRVLYDRDTIVSSAESRKATVKIIGHQFWQFR